LCRRHIAETFWGDPDSNPGFVEGHTFEGNPISSAAGLATLSEILERDLCANVRTQGERLRAGFESLKSHGIIGDIRGRGLMQCIELVADPQTKQQFDPAIGIDIGRRALQNGLICRFDPHWIALGPALTVTAEEIDQMLAILEQSIVEVLSELS
jgi:adenosylmethionine-8-amino-7-oxononanoate aminotransferase